MQNLFLLNDGHVIVQNNNKTYQDTAENFLLDLKEDIPQMKVDGKSQNINKIDYNQHSASCWLNGKAFQQYPNEFCEKVLAGIDTLLGNQTARNYKAPTLDELKTDKLAEIDAWTAAKITGGFVSNASGEAVTYDSDKDTQLTMQGIALNVNTELFAEKYPTGCPVRGYPAGSETKQIYMLTPAQVMQWQADLSIHIGTCKQNGWAKQAEVAAAQSKEDLEAIVLN